MWLSVWDHMQDIHTHSTPEFPECLHALLPPLVDKEDNPLVRDFLVKGGTIISIEDELVCMRE